MRQAMILKDLRKEKADVGDFADRKVTTKFPAVKTLVNTLTPASRHVQIYVANFVSLFLCFLLMQYFYSGAPKRHRRSDSIGKA